MLLTGMGSSWSDPGLFECYVTEEREAFQEAELRGELTFENDLRGSSETMYFCRSFVADTYITPKSFTGGRHFTRNSRTSDSAQPVYAVSP